MSDSVDVIEKRAVLMTAVSFEAFIALAFGFGLIALALNMVTILVFSFAIPVGYWAGIGVGAWVIYCYPHRLTALIVCLGFLMGSFYLHLTSFGDLLFGTGKLVFYGYGIILAGIMLLLLGRRYTEVRALLYHSAE